jgi:membrane-associated protein
VAELVESVLGGVPTWVLYLCVFALPFLEASVFLGFVFPGETALVFGGLLAKEGEVSLSGVLLLAVVGAVTGDAVGYAVGRRYGGALQRSALGRKVGEQRWATTQRFLHRRGAPAVFFGRWTALLRAMVPSAAGMAHVPYRTFFFWNVLGGTLWAVVCVVGGYFAGVVVGQYVSDVGLVIVVVVVLLVVVHFWKAHREKKKTELTTDPSES